jgi:hypothetical protein
MEFRRGKAGGAASGVVLASAVAVTSMLIVGCSAASGPHTASTSRSMDRGTYIPVRHTVRCPNGPSKSLPKPPSGFDPVTADAAALAKYGFPPRPPGGPDSPAVRGWDVAMSHAKHWVPAGVQTCSTVVHYGL